MKVLIAATKPELTKPLCLFFQSRNVEPILVDCTKYHCTLSQLLNKETTSPLLQKPFANCLLVFDRIPDPFFDRLLTELKAEFPHTYFLKAITTATNRNWTVQYLYKELLQEVQAFQSMR